MHDYRLALAGGIMIGSAALLLHALQGRVMGISGIASQLLPPITLDWIWRVRFIAGLLVAAPSASYTINER